MSWSSFLKRVGRSVPVLLMFCTGCGHAETTSVQPPPVRACIHPYYPLKRGYQVRYEIQAHDLRGRSQTYHYSQQVENETENTATLITDFQDVAATAEYPVTSEQVITCDDQGLHAETYVDLGARLIGDLEIPYDMITHKVMGVLLPQNLHIGSVWDGGFAVTMTPTASSTLSKPIDLNIEVRREVVGEETITVPAGTYQALRISAITKITGEKITMQSIQATEWWVSGVGLVKSIYPTGGPVGTITTIAQSILVP